jgi:tripeptidyl-peptidase-1
MPDNYNEPFLEWVNWFLDQESFPQVISTSYGEDEQTVPRSYAERVCRQFAAVGARGTSLIFASGNRGVGSFNQTLCRSNDGKDTYKFLPVFPASCPYVTSVGATKEFSPEVAAWRPMTTAPDGSRVGNFSSGGGFSNYFSMPRYQRLHVSKYVGALGEKYEGLYNSTGRAYPDMSAQAVYHAFFWNGNESIITGTSAAAPLAASIISLVNDALLSAGKSQLGFLNPWLYAKGFRGLNDITSGTQYGCGTDGFPVADGWDPVTGFGTPNFPELVRIAGGKLD